MSNIDEKAKNNFTIEMRIFENYEKVKYEIIKVIDFLRHAETNLGMCRIFDNQNHEFWHSVIKPWFKPERFGITHLWFPSGFSFIGYGEYHIIRGNRWLKTPIDKIDKEDRIFGYWFPPYKKYIPHRIKILNARDVFILWLLCMLCLGMPLTCVEIFVCSMFKAFLGMPLIRKPKNTRY